MGNNQELEQFITEYVYNTYSQYINGNTIWYAKASFTVDMLIAGSIETCNLNPEKEFSMVVDYMFEYYCS